MSNPLSPTAPPLPPVSPPPPPPKSGSLRATLAVLFSLYLALFVVDAIVSLIDDSAIWWLKLHLLSPIRNLLGVLVLLASLGVYLLIGLTPMIPKRLFLPLALFTPLAFLGVIPPGIYFYDSLPAIAWTVSLIQVGVGLAVLYGARGGFQLGWPLVREDRFKAPSFSWRRLLAFLLINIFVLLPGTLVYLFVCASVAVNHFSDGFVGLRTHGLTVQARKYVRADGKQVQLFPMAHVADRDFYRMLAESFTSNSIALMEGVTDEQGLLTNHITYQRMAEALGVAEQQKEFNPTRGELVAADVDVGEFTPNTIGFLNLVMRVHAKGLTPEILIELMQFTPPPGFERQLLDDLLHKRNLHVVEELQARLADSDDFIIPWGAAHMPGIAKEIQKIGFRLEEKQDFTVLQFRSSNTLNESSQCPPLKLELPELGAGLQFEQQGGIRRGKLISAEFVPGHPLERGTTKRLRVTLR